MSVGPVFTDKVTTVPADWANSVTDLVYTVFNQAATVVDARSALGLGTLALQNSNNISVTGGTLDGTVIGPLNPQTARFTIATVTQLTPVLPGHLTSKQYVDLTVANIVNSIIAGDVTPALLAGKVNKSGDTMTGLLILSGDPTAPLGAATKEYVDNSTGTGGATVLAQAKAYTDTSVAAALVTAQGYVTTLQTQLANETTPSLGAGMIGYNNTTVYATLNTLTPLVAPKAKNLFYGGPASGANAVPAFRQLVIGDLVFAGVANGVATLDANGLVPLSQIPPSLIGGINYQGTWNATTNTPTLTSGTGTKGYMYTVSVAGTTNLDGITQWNVGDQAVFSGTVWQKLDGVASEVLSVAGRTGNVVLTYADIGGLATVAHSGSFTDLTNVPKATTSSLGLVQVGANLTVDGNGVLAATASPLVPATTSVLGGIIVGANLSITVGGVLSANAEALVPATTSTLGGVIVGSGLSVTGTGVISIAGGSAVNQVQNEGTGTGLVDNNGITGGIATIRSLAGGPGVTIVASGDNKTLTINATSAVTSVNSQTGDVVINAANLPNLSVVGRTGSYLDLLNLPTTFNPPIATASVLGGVKIGSGLAVAGDGTISVTASIQPATTTTLGGVIVPAGSNLTVGVTGDLSVNTATASSLGVVQPGAGLNISSGILAMNYASTSAIGGIIVGSGLQINSGILSVTATNAVSSLNSLTGAVTLTAGNNIALTPSGNSIRIDATSIGEAPNDGNAYVRQSLAWAVLPDGADAITAVNGQTGTGAILLVEASPPANTAIIKSLLAGTNITITENAGLLTIAAALPAGTVASVNGIAPNGSGNVTLTAANVNALPTAGGAMSGTINMESNVLTGLTAPVNPSDAVPLSYITGITSIDAGTF